MKKSQNGFTLVELLATLAILAIIMLIAVPNVMGILDRNKRSTYIEDAKKLVTLADYKFRQSQTIPRLNNGECVVFRMSSLDVSEIKNGPEGTPYNVNQSFVAIRYNGSRYEYGVRLAEAKNQRGIRFTNSTLLNDERAMMQAVANNTAVVTLGLNRYISGTSFSSCKIVSYN